MNTIAEFFLRAPVLHWVIMAVTIVNRIYPPIRGITGEAANELASYLVNEANVATSIVHVDGEYGIGKTPLPIAGVIHKVRAIYNGRNRFLRLAAALIESFLLVWKAKQVNDGIVILMTDPPFLEYWSSWLMPRNVTVIVWSMDLFPEAFAASRLTRKTGILFRHHIRRVSRNPPQAIIALGPGQREFLNKRYATIATTFVAPCGTHVSSRIGRDGPPPWYAGEDVIHLGYCGNVGEAHSLAFVTEVAKRVPSSTVRLIVSPYGPKAKRFVAQTKDMPNVQIVNWVNRQHLSYIDVHLVTLHTEWTHLSVPSKAVSAVCACSSILFCGSVDSDTWRLCRNAGWHIDDTVELGPQVDEFFRELSLAAVRERQRKAVEVGRRLVKMRHDTFAKVAALIQSESESRQSE